MRGGRPVARKGGGPARFLARTGPAPAPLLYHSPLFGMPGLSVSRRKSKRDNGVGATPRGISPRPK